MARTRGNLNNLARSRQDYFENRRFTAHNKKEMHVSKLKKLFCKEESFKLNNECQKTCYISINEKDKRILIKIVNYFFNYI